MTNPQTESLASIERFNTVADAWDENPIRLSLARGVASSIIDALPLTGTEHAMELGCGTGLVTALLAGSLGHVLAVDSSQGMLDVLRRKVHELGIGNVQPAEMDLSQQMPAGPFDLVFSSMTLHHIEDVAGLFQRVHNTLAPGGRIAFADLAREDGSFHASDIPGVMHHGFDPTELVRWLELARFVDAQVRTAHIVRKSGADGSTRDYPVLLVTARRAEFPAA